MACLRNVRRSGKALNRERIRWSVNRMSSFVDDLVQAAG